MGYPTEVRKYSYVTAPRAYGSPGPVGQVVVLPVSSSASAPPNLVGTTDTTAAGLYGSGGTLNGKTLILIVDGTSHTLALAGSGNTATDTALNTAIHSTWSTVTSSQAMTTGFLTLVDSTTGLGSGIVVGAGTANTLLGLVQGQAVYGTDAAQMLELDTCTFGMTYASGDLPSEQGLGAPPGAPEGLMGNYLTLYADGADVGVIFGASPFAVTSQNKPILANAGSVSPVQAIHAIDGAPTTPPANSSSALFSSASALFTPAMVGLQIQIAGDAVNLTNNGVFRILGYVSSSQVRIDNPGAITTTSLSWGVFLGGQYTGTLGTCWRIPSGGSLRVLTQVSQDLFLGYVGSTTGNLRIYQSNAPGIEG